MGQLHIFQNKLVYRASEIFFIMDKNFKDGRDKGNSRGRSRRGHRSYRVFNLCVLMFVACRKTEYLFIQAFTVLPQMSILVANIHS